MLKIRVLMQIRRLFQSRSLEKRKIKVLKKQKMMYRLIFLINRISPF